MEIGSDGGPSRLKFRASLRARNLLRATEALVMAKFKPTQFPLVFCSGAAGYWSGAPGGFDGLNDAGQLVFKGNQIRKGQDDTRADDSGRSEHARRKQRSRLTSHMSKRKSG